MIIINADNRRFAKRVMHYFSISMTVLGICIFAMGKKVHAQIELKGINTAPNLAGSYNGESLPRDSGFNEPLDLLNDFYPSIEVRLQNHSNIQRRSDVENSDTKLIVSPTLGYRTNIGRHGFYAAYTGSFERHADFEQEDSNSHGVNLKLGLDLSKRWDLDLFGGLGSAREERGISGTRDFFLSVDDGVFVDQGPDRISYDNVGFDLIYGRKLGKLVAVLGYERGSSSFRSESGDLIEGGNRDRSTESLHLDVSYRFAGNTSVFARIEHNEVDFNRFDASLDSEEVEWLVGLRVKATNRLSGVIGYGEIDRDFDDVSLNGYDGNTYYANLTYAITPFSTLQFGASRSVEEPSTAGDGSFFTSELFSVSWEHAVTDNLVFDSYVKTLDDDFDNGRRDEFFDWGLGLDYALEPWLTVGAFYEDIDRDSNVDGVAYEDRVFGIRLKSDLRPLLSRQRARKNPEPVSFSSSQRSSASQ